MRKLLACVKRAITCIGSWIRICVALSVECPKDWPVSRSGVLLERMMNRLRTCLVWRVDRHVPAPERVVIGLVLPFCRGWSWKWKGSYEWGGRRSLCRIGSVICG